MSSNPTLYWSLAGIVSILIDYLLDQGVVMGLEEAVEGLADWVEEVSPQTHGPFHRLNWKNNKCKSGHGIDVTLFSHKILKTRQCPS